MDDLIERLEKTTGPNRELDARIWAEIDDRYVRVGKSHFDSRWPDADSILAKSRAAPHDECVLGVRSSDGFMTAGLQPPIPYFTASIDAALPGENIVQTLCLGSVWEALHSVSVGINGPFVVGRGATEAIARRVAALKARKELIGR